MNHENVLDGMLIDVVNVSAEISDTSALTCVLYPEAARFYATQVVAYSSSRLEM